jgi:hypothetical protein
LKKKGDKVKSHYDDQTIENLKSYYMVGDQNYIDLLRFIKTHGTHHDSDEEKRDENYIQEY